MPGLNKLLRGILQYQATLKPRLLQQFKEVRDKPEPTAVMFSCMDSRILITRLLQCDVGDMFLVRNAGNLIPHNHTLNSQAISTEPGALELGCVKNNIRHVLVCGHSDCKAMNGLYAIKDSMHANDDSPLNMWLRKHGANSLAKYQKLLDTPGGHGSIQFQAEDPNKYFNAFIDEEDKFAPADKLSQVNALQQIENISSHPVIHDKIGANEVCVNAFWFDVYNANFYMFSRSKERYLPVIDDNLELLIHDGETTPDKIRSD